jgi:hypothetical protein
MKKETINTMYLIFLFILWTFIALVITMFIVKYARTDTQLIILFFSYLIMCVMSISFILSEITRLKIC